MGRVIPLEVGWGLVLPRLALLVGGRKMARTRRQVRELVCVCVGMLLLSGVGGRKERLDTPDIGGRGRGASRSASRVSLLLLGGHGRAEEARGAATPAERIHLHWLLAYSDDDVEASREFRSVYLDSGRGWR
eukprot:scaffold6015_cov69-Isochrysis_galbana.AAC.1